MVEQNNGEVETSGADSERPKGARSETQYPYWGLSHAIEIVQAVRRAGGKEASSDAVMKEMGVTKSTDRRWTYGVPSAKLFGLIERIGRGDAGRIKVTDLALRVTNPVTPEAGRTAKIAALKTPELYTKLLEQFAGHPKPAPEGLKNLLYTDHGIVESMAMGAAEAFLDSIEAAGLVNAKGEIMIEGALVVSDKDGKGAPSPPTAPPSPPGMQSLLVPAEFVIYKCKIGGGRVIDIPLPPKFTQSDVKRLYAFLQTQVDDDADGEGGTTT